jgi:hypothetical protein
MFELRTVWHWKTNLGKLLEEFSVLFIAAFLKGGTARLFF